MVDFPKDFRSREREFPEISPGIPGNFKTHFIKTQKHPNSEENAIHWRISMISSMGAIFLDSKAWSKPKEKHLKNFKIEDISPP